MPSVTDQETTSIPAWETFFEGAGLVWRKKIVSRKLSLVGSGDHSRLRP
jgi:hypothetical protein